MGPRRGLVRGAAHMPPARFTLPGRAGGRWIRGLAARSAGSPKLLAGLRADTATGSRARPVRGPRAARLRAVRSDPRARRRPLPPAQPLRCHPRCGAQGARAPRS